MQEDLVQQSIEYLFEAATLERGLNLMTWLREVPFVCLIVFCFCFL